ncbi:MAG: sigma-70 family RNA polymerase sigma factor [Patulibacter minatonensis]
MARPPGLANFVNVSAAVAAASSGDRAAWDRLVDRYTPLLWSVARSHRLSDSDAADVVQTTWLRLVEHLGRINDPERVGAWLATTARRESLRLVGASAARTTPVAEFDDLVEASPGPQDQLLTQDRAAVLRRALAQLPESCRRLLRVLTADPAPSYEDVSAALDMPIGSIGPTRGRCLERLRHECEGLGITDAG